MAFWGAYTQLTWRANTGSRVFSRAGKVFEGWQWESGERPASEGRPHVGWRLGKGARLGRRPLLESRNSEALRARLSAGCRRYRGVGRRVLFGQLGGEAGGVPVLPGFGEMGVLDANDGGAGDFEGLRGGGVAQVGGPMETDKVAFGNRNDGRELEVGELGANSVLEAAKSFRAMDLILAVVENRTGREEFENGFAASLVPDLFEPADDEVFVLFLRGKWLSSGRHGSLLRENCRKYTGRNVTREEAKGGKNARWLERI